MFIPDWVLIITALSLVLIMSCGALWVVATRALNHTLAEHMHKMAKQMLDDRIRVGVLNKELTNCSAALDRCRSAAADTQKPKGPVH